MTEILSAILHINHNPISGEYFMTCLLHDGGHQVDKHEWRGPQLLPLLGVFRARQLSMSALYFAWQDDPETRYGQNPGEQTELPF